MDWLALLLALGLVGLNGFFVATEFAIVKVRPTRIEELIRSKKRGAVAVRGLVREIDAYLSATQLGITLASLGLGWLGEPAFARLLDEPLIAMGMEDPVWRHNLTLTLAFSTISFLHIVVGELAPKSLAIIDAERVALAVAYPMRFFYLIFYPAIWALNGVANLLLRAVGIAPAGHATDGHHSEEELKIIVSQARSAGLLSAAREELVHKALSLPSKTARMLMVPRNDVVFLDVNQSLEENVERARRSGHTRFPLCRRELDDVIGMIDIRMLLYHNDPQPDLEGLAEPIIYLPEIMSAEHMLHEFRARKAPMAVVVDEYGGASGIATPLDVVSAVMGELDDDDEVEFVPLPSGGYEVEGSTTLEEIEEILHAKLPTSDMRTIAGYLMSELGRMPKEGDRINLSGHTLTVLSCVGPRVQRVRLQREGGAATQAPEPAGTEGPPDKD